MNYEELYNSHVDIKYEMKMDRVIFLNSLNMFSLPIVGVMMFIYLLIIFYNMLILHNDVKYWIAGGALSSLIILLSMIFIMEFSNPTKRKTTELQLFLWQVYFIKATKKLNKLPRNSFSFKYNKYLALRYQIVKRLTKIRHNIENSYIFSENHQLELERYLNIRKSIFNIEVSKVSKDEFDLLIELMVIMTQIYSCVYTEKITGKQFETIEFVDSSNNIKLNLENELEMKVNKILEIENSKKEKRTFFTIITKPESLRVLIGTLVVILLFVFYNLENEVEISRIGLYISIISSGLALMSSIGREKT